MRALHSLLGRISDFAIEMDTFPESKYRASAWDRRSEMAGSMKLDLGLVDTNRGPVVQILNALLADEYVLSDLLRLGLLIGTGPFLADYLSGCKGLV